MPEIRVEKLSTSYGKQHILKNVDFIAETGKISVLLGPSGAGKTTLLRCIAGLSKQEEGKIFFDEKDVSDLTPPERKIAMIFQNAALFEHTRIKDNIAYGLHKLGYEDSEIEQMVHSSAAALHIEHLLERYPGQLSGGERQRASIARAIVRRPSTLLLDEPFSSLDARLSEELCDEMIRLQKNSGMTMIMVTHDQKEAMRMGDVIALMNEGRIVSCGTPSELYDSPPDLFTAQFIGIPKINVIYRESALFARLKDYYHLSDSVASFGLRPDSFMIKEDADGICEVTRCSFGGGAYEIHALCLDTPLVIISSEPFSRGTRFQICAPQEKVLRFDEKGLCVTG